MGEKHGTHGWRGSGRVAGPSGTHHQQLLLGGLQRFIQPSHGRIMLQHCLCAALPLPVAGDETGSATRGAGVPNHLIIACN